MPGSGTNEEADMTDREPRRDDERENTRERAERDIEGEWGAGYGGGYGRSGHYGERGGPGRSTRGPQSGEAGGDSLPERTDSDD